MKKFLTLALVALSSMASLLPNTVGHLNAKALVQPSELTVNLGRDGRLVIRGTPRADDVLLRLDPARKNIEIDNRQTRASSDYNFNFALVRSIHIFLEAGDDWVILDSTNGSLGVLRPLEINVGDGDNSVIGSTGSLNADEIAALSNTVAQLKKVLNNASSLREGAEKLTRRSGYLNANDGVAFLQTAEYFSADAQKQLIDPAEALRKDVDREVVPVTAQYPYDRQSVLQQPTNIQSPVDLVADREVNDFVQRLGRVVVETGKVANDDRRLGELVDQMEIEIDNLILATNKLESWVAKEPFQPKSTSSPERRALEVERAGDIFLERADREILGGGTALLGGADAIASEADAIARQADVLLDALLPVVGKLFEVTAVQQSKTPVTQQLSCTFTTTNTISGSGLIIGTPGNDLLIGSTVNDLMLGLGGNDRMRGDAGDDVIFGLSGGDDMYGEAGNDFIFGNDGDDCISGGDGVDFLLGNQGKDTMHGNDGPTITFNIPNGTVSLKLGDLMFGNEGDDEMYGDEGLDLMLGNTGIDTLHGNDGADFMFGNQDADKMYGEAGKGITITIGANPPVTPPVGNFMFGNTEKDQMWGGVDRDFIWGNEDNDKMSGDADIDFMFGGTGIDTMNGNDGFDLMFGNQDNDTILGDNGNDFMFGDAGVDTMNGNAGTDLMWGNRDNDTMNGNAGADLMWGNEDKDTMHGDDGLDSMWGNEGDDTMHGDLGADFMWGNRDNDTMNGNAGIDSMWGNEGNDTMHGDDSIDSMWGNEGDDTMHGDIGADFMWGNQGNDTMHGNAGTDSMWGNQGNDTMNGNAEADFMWGSEDSDTMHGNDGIDSMWGNEGDDTMHGDLGADLMWGNQGDDTMSGNDGSDSMWGNQGDDRMFGNPGNDRMFGNEGDDCMDGGDGTDFIEGNQGNDGMFGGLGNDLIFGNDGEDCMDGGGGNDNMFGNQGDDRMLGAAGNDRMFGNQGNDLMDGGAGTDFMCGNQGSDNMFGGPGADAIFGNQGNNTISQNGSSGVTCPVCSASTPKCDLKVEKKIQPSPLVSGQPFTTTIDVTNVGTGSCNQGVITLTDMLPPALKVISVTQGGSQWNCSVTGANPPAIVTCSWNGSLQPLPPAGSLPPIIINGTATAPAGSSIQNCATVTNSADINPTNNTGCATAPIAVAPPNNPCVLSPGMTAASNTFGRRATLAQTFTPTQSGALTQITHGLQSISGVTNYDLLVTTTTSGLPSWTGGTYNAPNVLFKALGLTVFSNSGVVNGVVTIPSGQEPFLTAGTQYAFILIPGSPATGDMKWRGNSGAGSYPNGSAFELNGATWTVPTVGPRDHGFKLDGLCP